MIGHNGFNSRYKQLLTKQRHQNIRVGRDATHERCEAQENRTGQNAAQSEREHGSDQSDERSCPQIVLVDLPKSNHVLTTCHHVMQERATAALLAAEANSESQLLSLKLVQWGL